MKVQQYGNRSGNISSIFPTKSEWAPSPMREVWRKWQLNGWLLALPSWHAQQDFKTKERFRTTITCSRTFGRRRELMWARGRCQSWESIVLSTEAAAELIKEASVEGRVYITDVISRYPFRTTCPFVSSFKRLSTLVKCDSILLSAKRSVKTRLHLNLHSYKTFWNLILTSTNDMMIPPQCVPTTDEVSAGITVLSLQS